MLPARAQEEDSSLQLFLTEAIAGSQSTASTNSPPSSTGSTASAEASPILTAVIRFSLTEGKMNHSGYEDLEGDMGFVGAMQFLPEQKQLSMLLTETLDDSSDESLRSDFYLYNTTDDIVQVCTPTLTMRCCHMVLSERAQRVCNQYCM